MIRKRKEVEKTTDEIEGCWTRLRSRPKCPKCKATEIIGPKEGHVNSKFWAYAQEDGMVLKACPKGCLVEEDQ